VQIRRRVPRVVGPTTPRELQALTANGQRAAVEDAVLLEDALMGGTEPWPSHERVARESPTIVVHELIRVSIESCVDVPFTKRSKKAVTHLGGTVG
jgi:hypothetical protein